MKKQISPDSNRLREIRKKFHDSIQDYAKEICLNPEDAGNISAEDIYNGLESSGIDAKAVFQKEVDYLGSYTPMSSPGIIKLNIVPLTHFYWWIFAELKKDGFKFSPLLLEEMVFNKTLNHELFHYFSDYVSYITSRSKIHNTEEALAVACSYLAFENKYTYYYGHMAKWQYCFLKVAFAYTSPGYKDYVNYISRNAFYQAIIDYKGQNGILNEKDEYALVENLMLAIMNKPYVKYITETIPVTEGDEPD
jgi:hypothetical protein